MNTKYLIFSIVKNRRRIVYQSLALGFLLFCNSARAQADAGPKLVILLVGDQVRADYLERYHKDLVPDGLRRFRDEGLYYTHALQDHAITKTSPGHALIGSGLYAKDSGIVGNEWYDRASRRIVSAAEIVPGNPRTALRWFAGHSLAERLHERDPESRVVGVSLKDRAALLLGGPGQDEAYWWDHHAKAFVSYHGSSLWLDRFNETHKDVLQHKKRMGSVEADALTELLAEEILRKWELGRHSGHTDLLTVSFSAVDLVGHQYGPESPETRAAFLNLDRQVERLMKTVEAALGGGTVWVFSSDHGITPIPERSREQGLAAGRVSFSKDSLPHPEWIEAVSAPFVYLRSPEHAAAFAEELRNREGVAAVYTKADISIGKAPVEILRDFYPSRCGDLWVVLKPKYIFSNFFGGTTHGQPTEDDERVPLGFYGPGFAPAVRDKPTSVKIIPEIIMEQGGGR